MTRIEALLIAEWRARHSWRAVSVWVCEEMWNVAIELGWGHLKPGQYENQNLGIDACKKASEILGCEVDYEG